MDIVICDDEKWFRDNMKQYISESNVFDDYTIHEFSSADNLIQSAQKGLEYDIVLLDIEMEGINGVGAGKQLRDIRNNCIIIYVTGYPQYAIDAIDNEPISYILKPVDKEKMTISLKRAKEKLYKMNQKINIQCNDGFLSLLAEDIVYIEYYNRHLTFVCADKSYVANGKISDMAEKLSNFGFILINQAVLINAAHVRHISHLDITMDNNDVVHTSVRRKSEVFKRYEKFVRGRKV